MLRRKTFLSTSLVLCFSTLLPAPLRAAPERPAGDSPQGRPVTLTVQVDVQPRGSQERRPVQPGETLHTGDRIALRVEVDQRAYVKILQVFPSGKSTVLFPASSASKEESLIEPGVQQGLPRNGAMLELDEELGQESIIVTASTRFLGLSDPEQRLAGGAASQSTPEAAVDPGAAPAVMLAIPPPYPLEPGERKTPQRVPGKPYLLRVRSTRDGVALLRFEFKHASAALTRTIAKPAPRPQG